MTEIGPGDIVVCVGAEETRLRAPSLAVLVDGARYRVREAETGYDQEAQKETPVVTLAGIVNNKGVRGCREYAYCLSWFRPLRKSDSEIFHKMIKLKETA